MATATVRPKESPAAYRDKALKSLDKLPPLAPSVGRLLSKLAFCNVNYKELASFVEKDALLCAHILRTVNSAAYASSRTITSLTQAMTLLGIGALRRIAIGFTLSGLFNKTKAAASWSRMRFNLHSGATAILTEAIADEMLADGKEGAFVAGMFHDLGRLLIAVGLPERYETIVTLHQMSGKPIAQCERDSIYIDHAELSSIALKKWGLPELVCLAAAYHHEPEAKGAPWLATVVNRADHFVNHLGISVLMNGLGGAQPPSLDIPGVHYDQSKVLQRFEREWKDLSSFFQ
jgi:HD-like signal output (HDOD) protein